MRGERWPDARDLLTALLVAVACGAGARLGTAVRFPSTGTAFLFLPYAVLAAALILSPPRRWWLYLLAAAAGDLGPHLSGGSPLSFVLLAELANWSRALVAAICMRRFLAPNDRLDTLRSMSIFLLIAGLLAPLVGAILGAATVALHHGLDHYTPAFRAWLVSNGITGLTVLPVILLGAINIRVRLGRRDRFGAPPPVAPLRVLEAAALLLTLLVVGGAVLLGAATMGSRLPVIIYAPLSLLLWSAVRFGPLGTSASVLLLTVLSIVGIARGYGPFANESPALDLIHLQMFLFTRSVPLLLLAALIQQQRSTAQALRASQEQHRAVIEDQTEPICRFQPDGTLTFVNGAGGRTLGQRPEALVGQNFWSLMPPGRPGSAGRGPDQPAPRTARGHLGAGTGVDRRRAPVGAMAGARAVRREPAHRRLPGAGPGSRRSASGSSRSGSCCRPSRPRGRCCARPTAARTSSWPCWPTSCATPWPPSAWWPRCCASCPTPTRRSAGPGR